MPDHVHLLIWPEENGHIVSAVLHSVKGKTGRQYKDHLILNTPEIVDAFCIKKKSKKDLNSGSLEVVMTETSGMPNPFIMPLNKLSTIPYGQDWYPVLTNGDARLPRQRKENVV